MKMLKEKRFRYGTFSTAMMLFAVVLFVLVNLFADELNRSFDLTAEQIFTLTAESNRFLDNLDVDVTIIHVAPVGGEHAIIAQLLEEYAAASRHITAEIRDPMLNPALMMQLANAAGIDTGIPNGSVVVQSATATRVIRPWEMIMMNINQQGQAIGIRSFNFETEITRAIHAVSQGVAPVIYYVTGSGEPPIEPGLRALLERENFVVREVNLVTHDVPETADILMIAMPGRDWAEIKADRIAAFLNAEGRAFIALNYSLESFPQLDRVLSLYGIALGESLIFETNPHNHVQVPFFIIPDITEHPILDSHWEQNFVNLLVAPTYLRNLDTRLASVTIEPLFTTSRDAFARVGNEETWARVPGDIDGPFNMAVAITDSRFVETNLITRLVVVSNLGIIGDQVDLQIGGGNYQFVIDSLRWMSGRPQGIFIPARRPPGNSPLIINVFQERVMMGVAAVGLPLASIAVGIFIWFRRRHS